MFEWTEVYVHLFGITKWVGHIPADKHSLICAFHDAKRVVMNEGLTLIRKDFRIETMMLDDSKLNILKNNKELFDLMIKYKNKKVDRLDLYVEFNHLKVGESLKMLDINSYISNKPNNMIETHEPKNDIQPKTLLYSQYQQTKTHHP